MRLHNQQEKLEEENDSIVDYMWNEYELTYSYAAELRSEELTDISDIKKQINILKANIKKLGVVNVNAIEEYKEVSERYNFLKTQHDDMIKAEELPWAKPIKLCPVLPVPPIPFPGWVFRRW